MRPIARTIPWLALFTVLAAGPATEPSRTENVAFLGIGTSMAPPALGAQLDLPAGVGIEVDLVDPDSPAAQAGVAVHDVITRLDEQIVVNPHQFTVLVRLHHGGDLVKLTCVRQGKPLVLPVRLGERVVQASQPVRLVVPTDGERLSSIVRHMDAEHVITLTCHGRDRHVRIATASGTLIYDGPINTPQDAEKLPPACRGKIDAVYEKFEQFKRQRATTAPAR